MQQEWPEADIQFLQWLGPILKQRGLHLATQPVLRLPEAEFELWLEHWRDVAGRFIERATQKALGVRGAATFHVELADDGDAVSILALITAPNGRRYRVHDIFDLLASGRKGTVVDGQLLDFVTPISWQMLGDIFSRKTPRLARHLVPEHVPTVLEGRLDLLRGDNIVRRETTVATSIQVRSDGADLLLQACLGQRLAPLDSDVAATGSIARTGDKWLVTVAISHDWPVLRRLLNSLPLVRENDGWLRLPGDVANVEKLLAGWKQLPAAIEKQLDPSLRPLFAPPVLLAPEVTLRENHNFVDMQMTWTGADARLFDNELKEALAAGRSVYRTRGGGWLHLDIEAMRERRLELAAAGVEDVAFLRLFRHEAKSVLTKLQTRVPVNWLPGSQPLAERLLHETVAAPALLPPELAGVLRDYQRQGFEFLADRCAHRIGAILADDMGLGKTLQVLALLQAHFAACPRVGSPQSPGNGRGALVICPASVVGVWLAEAARFCPRLRLRAYAGTPEARRLLLEDAGSWDVLVANYALARIDGERLAELEFAFVILDEAQQIKNPESQIAQTVCRLRTARPLALTGTPLENHMLDLWSIMNYLNPGFLGSREMFLERYDQPARRPALSKRIAPVILRRLKEQVATELPSRTEEVLRVEFSDAQRQLYDTVLVQARAAVKERGLMEVLAALTRLRQICCHPLLLAEEKRFDERTDLSGSAKLDCLLELASEIIEEGHSMLVFSQFTTMLDIIGLALTRAKLPWRMITGETRIADRTRLVKEFQDSPQPELFLLSLKAAGTGLTLTKADYVIIYDPWWNPAVERQAIDRTHRIGQDKPVMAYRLAVSGTVEEKILALQAEKAELFAQVMADSERGALAGRLSASDLAALLE
ncbi:MAG: DEAD/DEAH box helicase [Gammaproteobacteria bacterium]|nr:DEAD/DEAH box helicase [Gammaproteobacteria bacterium]